MFLRTMAVVVVALLCASFVADAHEGVPVSFGARGGLVDVQTIAPGQSGTFAFLATNRGTVAGTGFVHAYVDSRIESVAQYAFAPNVAACGAVGVETDQYGTHYVFFPVTLAAGESVECRYTITRAPSSVDDLGLRVFGGCGFSTCVIRRGGFSDQALEIRYAPQPGDGNDALTFRLTMHNAGTRAATRQVTTECGEYGTGFLARLPYVLENDFPGACPNGARPTGCINFTGTFAYTFDYELGPAAPGASSSCLVRLRYVEGPIVRASVGMAFTDDRVELPQGAIAYDVEPANDDATLGFGGGGSGTLRATIPVPRGAAIATGLVVLLAAAWSLRRR